MSHVQSVIRDVPKAAIWVSRTMQCCNEMKYLFAFITLVLFSPSGGSAVKQDLYSFSVKKADGSIQPLSEFKGKVALVVNVASQCGFTSQYEGLEKLFKDYAEKGFVILGFPCNQFGGQEPGTDTEIQRFCKLKYGVSFPVFSKIDVNGAKEDPLYTWLKGSAKGIMGTEAIKWNFTKFLIDRTGNVLKRFAPQTKPEDLRKNIEKAL